jgi:putative SOS response-associated peptidase YedK
MFGLAALAENWIGPNGEEMETVAIATAAASADLAMLHHRVPVTLMAGDFARWLDCSSDDAAPVMALLKGPLPGEFTWHEVSTRVNHADNDDAQLLLPITDEQRAIDDAPRRAKAAPRKTVPPSVDDGQGSLF